MEIKDIRKKRREKDWNLLGKCVFQALHGWLHQGTENGGERVTPPYKLRKCSLFKGKEKGVKKEESIEEVGGQPGSCIYVEAPLGNFKKQKQVHRQVLHKKSRKALA